MSAIFISHSSADDDEAARLKEWLASQGHTSLFLDFDPAAGIRAGAGWEQTLYRQLRQCQAVIALVSPDWVASRWCFAELVQARERGKPVCVVKIRETDTTGVLGDIQHIDLTRRRDEGLERLRLGLLERGIDPRDAFDWDPARPPYPGLLAFEESDAAIFFGRGEALARTLETLDALRRQGADAPRFALLLGASGSGKSSLARAGVLPRLKKRPAEWRVLPPMRPQQEPLQELAAALAEAFDAREGPRSWGGLRAELQRAAEDPANGGRMLLDLTREVALAARQPDATVLLTVDQAEELFNYADPDAAARFLRLLRAALEQGDRRLMVLATLRSDFLGEFQSHPALQDKDYGHHLRYRALTVDPMPLRSVPEVIRGPARLAGLELDDGLIEAMVADIGDQDALPLLAFTLRLMYERGAAQGRLTLADYDAVGRLEGSVRREAERIVGEAQPGPEDVEALHTAFVPTLVRVNTDGSFARRRSVVDHLPRRVLLLLRRFVDARLLVSDRDANGRETHEVAHEALLRTWPQLSEWLTSDRDHLRLLEGLSRAAGEWEQGGRAADLLVHRDGRLQDVDALLQSPRFALPEGSAELAYLDACRAAQREREAAAHAEQERRVRDAERIAEEQTRAAQAQRRTATVFRRFSIVAGLLFLAAVGAAWMATQQYREADAAHRRVAQVQQIARHASDLTSSPQRSLLLAVGAAALQSPDAAGTLGAIDGLRQQLRSSGGLPLSGHPERVQSVAFSPDRRWLATGGADGLIRLWDLHAIDPAAAARDLAGHQGPVTGLAFAADGHSLFSAGRDGTLRTWPLAGDAARAGRVAQVDQLGAIRALATSPDGRWLAFGTETGALCLWPVGADGPDPMPCDPAWQDTVPVTNVVFSSRGRWLATTCTWACKGFSAPVRLYDLSAEGPERGPRLLTHNSKLTEASLMAIAIAPDEASLVVAYGYVAERWDLTQPEPPKHVLGTYLGGGGWIQTLGLSPDGRWLALGSGSSADVRVWDLQAGTQDPLVLGGHNGPVNVVAFDGSGNRLASAAADGSLNVWDLTHLERQAIALRGHDASIAGVGFAPGADPGFLLSWGDDARPRLWRLPDALADPLVMRAPVAPLIASMAVSPDGRWIAASSFDDARLALWSAQDHRRPAKKLAMPGAARSIAFSRDGRWLAAKSQGQGRISLWNLRDLTRPPLLLVEDAGSDDRTLSFSPDSRWLASGTWGAGQIRLWDVSADQPAHEPRHRCRAGAPVRAITFSGDGAWMASAAHDRAGYLWNMKAADPCAGRVALPAGDVVYEVAVSKDGHWAASASMDGKGRVWELQPDAPPRLAREVEFGDRVVRAAISPDGRWAAFGSWDRSAALVDLKAPQSTPPLQLRGHVGRIVATTFSPDGQWLVTSGEDRTIRLWRPDAPQAAPVVLHGHTGAVWHLGFTPDGSWLVSAAYDGTLRRWRMRLDDLVKAACATAGRTLTRDEQLRYLGDETTSPCAVAGR